MPQAVLLVSILFTIIFMSDVQMALAVDHTMQTATGQESRAGRAGQSMRSARDESTWHSRDGPAPVSAVLETPADTSSGGTGSLTAGEGEPPVGESVTAVPSDLKHDWRGLSRDTMFSLGYQAAAAGILD